LVSTSNPEKKSVQTSKDNVLLGTQHKPAVLVHGVQSKEKIISKRSQAVQTMKQILCQFN